MEQYPLTLNIAIGSGDVIVMQFDTIKELVDYINDLDRFDCVWLMTFSDDDSDIVVTESIEFMCHLLGVKSFHKDSPVLFIQEYQSYEDAYKVALDMKDSNPKCYDN